ncbi:MAG: ABC transporter permease [Verrucomicrobiales bacterium]
MTLFLRQLWGEIVKMSARKRTYVGFAAFLGLEAGLVWILNTPQARRHFQRLIESSGFDFGEYWSMLTLAVLIISWTVFLLGGIYLALVMGDIVAKETEEGSFRLLMSRPVSRLRILLLKYAAGTIYTFALILFIGLTSLVVAALNRGWGGSLFIWAPEQGVFEMFGFADGLKRYLCALPLLALSTLTTASIAFMFSCFKIKPATAAILAVTVNIVDMILISLPFATGYREFSLLNHMAVYAKSFAQPVPWALLVREYVFLLGANATCFIIGWLAFQTRDFKS